MKLLDRVKGFFSSRFYIASRYVFTIVVTIKVTSPFYDANALVHVVWFKRHSREVEHIKVPLNEDYQIELGYLLERVPAHVVHVEYPNDWRETIEKLREEDRMKKVEG